MRVTIEQLRSFVTLAATTSFTRAAAALCLSQPALTTRIRQLEEALGLKLFDRSTRSVRLSDEGQSLLPTFIQLMGDLESAVLKAKDRSDQAHGVIRLACLPTCASDLLPTLIKTFRTRHPAATFVVNDGVNNYIHRLVRDGEVDFGICTAEEEMVDVDRVELYADTLSAVYASGHPLERVKRLKIKELMRHPLILTSRGSSVREVVDRAFAATGSSAIAACEVNYVSTSVALAKSGLGVAILPSSAVELRLQGISSRPIDDPGFVRKLALIRRKSVGRRAIVEQFIELMLQKTSAMSTPRSQLLRQRSR